jgi:hypothetical protein
MEMQFDDMPISDPYKSLASAVVLQAIEDARLVISPQWKRELQMKCKMNKEDAKYFLKGKDGSILDTWCHYADISRTAMQAKLRKKGDI